MTLSGRGVSVTLSGFTEIPIEEQLNEEETDKISEQPFVAVE